LKRLQVVEFEGDFLFEIFPQFYGLFNLMFDYQIVGRFEVYQDEILLPNGICQIMKKSVSSSALITSHLLR